MCVGRWYKFLVRGQSPNVVTKSKVISTVKKLLLSKRTSLAGGAAAASRGANLFYISTVKSGPILYSWDSVL